MCITIHCPIRWPITSKLCRLIDSHGEIWAGTMNGLCKYNIEEDNFETIPL